MCILNTMDNEQITSQELLKGTGVSIVDASRLIRNILDSKKSKLSNIEYCSKVIQVGLKNICSNDVFFEDGFKIYYEYKKANLRPDSLRDIRILGRRLMRSNINFAKSTFSELTRSDCEAWLNATFRTASQFNKARAMLHTLFEFALRKQWSESNPIKFIERKRIIEREIKPLSYEQAKELLKNAKSKNCSAMVGVMMLAGIRPREAKRLLWRDIDLEENSITVRSLCSKTGGIRHVEICPNLKDILTDSDKAQQEICPLNWDRKWKDIRDDSGFRGRWIQDILRHTYASYYAKYYRNLSSLQLNMGHRDQSLLRSRYINMHGISSSNAKAFFRTR